MNAAEESYPYSQYGDKKEKERPARFGSRGRRLEIEGYFFNDLWKVGKSPSPYAYRVDPGDHEPFFFIERSGEARRGVWALLRFANAYRPPWLEEDEPVRVFLPGLYLSDVPGDPIASVEIEGKRYTGAAVGARGVCFSFDPVFSIDCHLAEAHCRFRKPPGLRVPLLSEIVRKGPGRSVDRRTLKQRRSELEAKDPRSWFIAKGQDSLRWLIRESLRAAGAREPVLQSLWPENKKYAVCLTHELSGTSRRRWIEEVARIEEGRGITSSWFASGARSHGGLTDSLDSVRAHGHEVGLLGDRFGPILALCSDIAVRRRLDRSEQFIRRWEVRGFRSSSTISSAILRTVLGEFELYDSSIPDIDPFSPADAGRGCNCVHPYRINGIPEVPITLPKPERLIALGQSPEEMMERWGEKIRWIKEMRGVAVFSSQHGMDLFGRRSKAAPSRWLSLYEGFLDKIQDDGDAWITTSAAVADRCK